MQKTTEDNTLPLNEDKRISKKKVSKNNRKRQIILRAAQEVFFEKGLNSATITEIAKKAEVTDSIIYHYFKNKEDLLFCALDLQLKTSLDELMFYFKGIMGPVSKLGKMVWYHLYMNDSQNASMRRNLLLECRAHENFYSHETHNNLNRYTEIMKEIIQDGIDEGYFRDDLDIELVKTVIFGFLDEESMACEVSENEIGTLSNFDAIMEMILAMIRKKVSKDETNGKPDKFTNILKAATGIFAKKGYNNTTMVDISKQAGVAEGTIYEYFKNKQDLLLSVAQESMKTYKKRLDESFTFDNPLAKLKSLINQQSTIFAMDNSFLTVFLKDIKLNKYFYTSEAYSSLLAFYSHLDSIIKEGKKEGIIREDVQVDLFRNLIIGALANLSMKWYFRSKPSPLVYMNKFKHTVDLLCDAIVVNTNT